MEIILKEIGPNKVQVIKICREYTGMGLKEAKDIIDSAPVTLDVSDADAAIQAFGEAGAIAMLSEHMVDRRGYEYSKVVQNVSMEILENISKEEVEERFSNTDKIEPDEVGNLDRRGLLEVLGEILEITETLDQYHGLILKLKKDIEDKKRKAEEILKQRAFWLYGWSFLGGLVLGVILLVYMTCIGFILGMVAGCFITYKILAPIEMNKNSWKREQEYDEFLKKEIPPLEEQIHKLEEAIVTVENSEDSCWAKEIVGDELFYTDSIMQLYELVKNRRADNLKEALNKYDSTKHIEKMETMQRAIQNASELTAEEAAKQTAYAKKIEKNTHETATAAKATAYHTRQIDRSTRKISENTKNINKNTRRFR